MIRLFIILMICFGVVFSFGQSIASSFPDRFYNYLESVEDDKKTESHLDTCVQINGQLTTEDLVDIKLDLVRIQIIDLKTEEVVHLTSETDGSFKTCLPCERKFIILAYPRDYYCDEVRLRTEVQNCETGIPLKVNLPLQVLQIVEDEGEGSNMSTADVDSIGKLRAANKAFLESISIAEELPVDEDEIPQEYVAPSSPRLLTKPIDDKEEEEFDPSTFEMEQSILTNTSSSDDLKATESGIIDLDAEIPLMVLSPIYYPFDSDQLDEQDKEALDDVSAYLLKHSAFYLKIASYADPRGTKVYNKRLAKKRAQSVVEYLLRNGVQQTRLIAEAKGEIEQTKDYQAARRTELNIIAAQDDLNTNDELSGEKYISKIYYEFDDYQLNTQSREDLNNVISRMLSEPELTVEVLSHTDSRGSDQYNKWLSQKRANEVVRQMITAGLDAERIRGVGVGEEELVNDCSDGVVCSREMHAQNRRTEFVFL